MGVASASQLASQPHPEVVREGRGGGGTSGGAKAVGRRFSATTFFFFSPSGLRRAGTRRGRGSGVRDPRPGGLESGTAAARRALPRLSACVAGQRRASCRCRCRCRRGRHVVSRRRLWRGVRSEAKDVLAEAAAAAVPALLSPSGPARGRSASLRRVPHPGLFPRGSGAGGAGRGRAESRLRGAPAPAAPRRRPPPPPPGPPVPGALGPGLSGVALGSLLRPSLPPSLLRPSRLSALWPGEPGGASGAPRGRAGPLDDGVLVRQRRRPDDPPGGHQQDDQGDAAQRAGGQRRARAGGQLLHRVHPPRLVRGQRDLQQVGEEDHLARARHPSTRKFGLWLLHQ